MNPIDLSDCCAVVQFGPRLRLSLASHLFDFLKEEIRKRGFAADDPLLFSQLTFQVEAERLTNQLLDTVAVCVNDLIAEGELSDILAEALEECLAPLKAEYLADELFGVDWLIMRASGAPVTLHGDDGPGINLGQGPQ